MNPEHNQDLIFQCIGEYIVAFQGLENKLREIGWFIQDPEERNGHQRGSANLQMLS